MKDEAFHTEEFVRKRGWQRVSKVKVDHNLTSNSFMRNGTPTGASSPLIFPSNVSRLSR